MKTASRNIKTKLGRNVLSQQDAYENNYNFSHERGNGSQIFIRSQDEKLITSSPQVRFSFCETKVYRLKCLIIHLRIRDQ